MDLFDFNDWQKVVDEALKNSIDQELELLFELLDLDADGEVDIQHSRSREDQVFGCDCLTNSLSSTPTVLPCIVLVHLALAFNSFLSHIDDMTNDIYSTNRLLQNILSRFMYINVQTLHARTII